MSCLDRVALQTPPIRTDWPMTRLQLGVLLSLWLIPSATSANLLQPMSLREQRARADVVVLARAGQNTVCNVNAVQMPCVELMEPIYLKGRASHHQAARYLVTYSRIEELRVNCCTSGSTYLMFLMERGSYLFPVIGHWSILDVDRHNNLPLH